jgi:hypothetical protein
MLFIGCNHQINPAMPLPAMPLFEETIDRINMTSIVYNKFKHNVIINEKYPVLIYRYSNAMCQSCIFEDIIELKNFQKTIGKDNILVLPDYPKDRGSIIQLKNELADFRYKNIPSDSLIIPVNNIEGYQRYFAVVNKYGNIEMVFFPKRNCPELTKMYFTEIAKRLK